MELASREIQVRQGEEIWVLPVGDIQYAGEGSSTALTTLKEHIRWGVERKAIFIGMGDYVDFASPSNRQRLAGAALYDTANSVIELAAANLTKELFDRALKPSVGMWVGMCEGHHFYEYQTGITTDMELCNLLKTQHLGSSAFIRLVFKDKGSPNKNGLSRSGNVTIWIHHGAGSGSRAGSPLNKLDQLPIYFDADIYLMGHQTKKAAAPIPRIAPVWSGPAGPYLKHKTQIIACTGGFTRAYMAGNRHGRVPRGDYAEQKMLNPATIGAVKIKIIPRWTSQGTEGARLWTPEISVEQ